MDHVFTSLQWYTLFYNERRMQPTFDLVNLLPFSSLMSIPLVISFCRIRGMLTQFAAATAANGT